MIDTVSVQYDAQKNEYYIVSDLFEKAGFSAGDVVLWTDNGDGSWSLTKKNKDEHKHD